MSILVTDDERDMVPTLRAGSLLAEYSVAKVQLTGDWVALGTVHSLNPTQDPPAWMLVGLGLTTDDAIEDLRRQLEKQARGAARAHA